MHKIEKVQGRERPDACAAVIAIYTPVLRDRWMMRMGLRTVSMGGLGMDCEWLAGLVVYISIVVHGLVLGL